MHIAYKNLESVFGTKHKTLLSSFPLSGFLFFLFFILTLQSYYIKRHTAMIEGLDNRTRIPYYQVHPCNTNTRHITDYKLDNVILILQAFTL